MKRFLFQRDAAPLVAGAALATMVLVPAIGSAAPIRQSTNVEEGKCETVSAGQYFCKINGKCYYCDTKTNPDPNKNCYKETSCAAAITRPGLKGTMRPPISGGIMRRGVEGESTTVEGDQGSSGESGDVKERAVKKPKPRPQPVPPGTPPGPGTPPTFPK